eukprot:11295664-Alexandrium_andersonii.AAC.1
MLGGLVSVDRDVSEQCESAGAQVPLRVMGPPRLACPGAGATCSASGRSRTTFCARAALANAMPAGAT